jgi:hypothetical protein
MENPMSKTAIAITALFALIVTGVVVYFRTPIWDAILKAYNTLKTGYQPKPAAPTTTAK